MKALDLRMGQSATPMTSALQHQAALELALELERAGRKLRGATHLLGSVKGIGDF
jgi:hypothetical protein